MAILTAYDTSYSRDDYENFGTSGENIQSFTLDEGGTATAIEINGSRGSSASGTFKAEIRTSYNSGVIATTGTLTTTSTLPAYSGGGVDTFTSMALTAGVELTAGVTYFLALAVLTGAVSDEVRWNRDYTSPTYSGGSYINSSTGAPITGSDKIFRITGDFASSLPRRLISRQAINRAATY